MALPLLIPIAATGTAYVYGKWFSSDETPKGTAASVGTVAIYAAAGFGAYVLYKKARGT